MKNFTFTDLCELDGFRAKIGALEIIVARFVKKPAGYGFIDDCFVQPNKAKLLVDEQYYAAFVNKSDRGYTANVIDFSVDNFAVNAARVVLEKELTARRDEEKMLVQKINEERERWMRIKAARDAEELRMLNEASSKIGLTVTTHPGNSRCINYCDGYHETVYEFSKPINKETFELFLKYAARSLKKAEGWWDEYDTIINRKDDYNTTWTVRRIDPYKD